MTRCLAIFTLAAVTLAASPALADDLSMQLADEVAARIGWSGARVEISALDVRGKRPANGRLELRCDPTRTRNVQARLVGDGGRSAWVTAVIDVQVDVPVLVADVSRGDRLAGAAELQSMPLHDLRHNVVRTLSDLDEMIARRDLRAGDPVMESMVEAPQFIERRQLVGVIVRRGKVVVKMRAIALQSGRRGDVVRLKNPQSDQVLSGVVVAPGIVEVP